MTPINSSLNFVAQQANAWAAIEALMEQTVREMAAHGIAVVRLAPDTLAVDLGADVINPPFLYEPQGPWFSEGPCGPDCDCFTKYDYPAPEQTPDEQAIEAFMDEREELKQAIDAHMEEREGLVMAIDAFMEEREDLKADIARLRINKRFAAEQWGRSASEADHLAAILKEAEDRVTALVEQNAALQEENGKLAEELKESGDIAVKAEQRAEALGVVHAALVFKLANAGIYVNPQTGHVTFTRGERVSFV